MAIELEKKHLVAIIAILLVISGGMIVGFLFLQSTAGLPHEMVCQLTGEDALNDTTLVNVYGADIGLMVEYQDRLLFVFGDTFGPDKWDWRSNTIAYTLDTDPSDGITLTGWITDNATHLAKELIHSKKTDGDEMTAIPTAAYSNDDCLFIFYMSVKSWGDAGDWTCNNASIAYSTNGHTFTKAANMSWPGDSNFIEWGLIKGDETAPSTGGYLYFLATGSGRYHHCYLTRVHESSILNQSSYQYFAGLGPGDVPIWSSDHEAAEPIIEAHTGEITVMWNSYLSKYMVMNLDDVVKQILIRTAQSPWGPWSQPSTVISRPEYIGFYAPNIDPVLVEESGRIIYFTMSLWNEYNVYLMKVDLTELSGLYYLNLNAIRSLPMLSLFVTIIQTTNKLRGNNKP